MCMCDTSLNPSIKYHLKRYFKVRKKRKIKQFLINLTRHKRIQWKIKSSRRRMTLNETQHDRKVHRSIPRRHDAHYRQFFDLFWDLHTDWPVKRAYVPLPPHMHSRARMCQSPPHATNVAVRDAEYVRWTLTRKWRRRDRFVLGLRQQVDEVRAYCTPSTRRETKERKLLFQPKNDRRRPFERHATRF